MATNFPTSLDSFTNPSSSSTLDSPSHAAQHANINDAMEAVQTKLGVGAGTIGEWTTYSATLTAANPMTVTTTYARYCEVNGLVIVAAYFDITNNGGNTGTCDMDLPVAVASHYVSGALIGSGRENKLNGNSVLVHVSGTAGRLRYYNNGVTANNTYAYGVFLTYEAA